MEILGEAEFWVAVAFAIFVALTYKPGIKAIGGALDNRARRIKADLDEARRLREEAERLIADYRKKQSEGAAEADAIVGRAREEALRLRHEGEANLDAAFKRREKAALEKIAQAEAQAMAEVRNQAVDLAVAAARRILTEGLDAERGSALIGRSIEELGQRLR
jgi:F-type H+-transporting ATPase subunit b